MNKLLFVINDMNIGGIQKSLVSLLKNISTQYYIDLFCSVGGTLIDEIPENINIIMGNKFAKIPEKSLKNIKKEGFIPYVLRFFCSFWSKIFGKSLPSTIITKLMGKISNKKYDAAISFSQPINDKFFNNISNEIVLRCCDANLKITYVHCDFENYGGNTKYNRKLYLKFDKIVAVSDSVGKKLAEIIPAVKSKIYTVYNCHDYKSIIENSNKDPVAYSNTAIVTVSRLSWEKGLLRTVPLIKKLVLDGFDISWHIIGDGPLQKQLKTTIADNHLKNRVILHNKTNNPYRYIKNASLLLVPSYHEGAPNVYNEAAVLSVPILTTNTLSAIEIVEKNGFGFVCNNNENDLYKALKTFLTDGFDKNLYTFDNNLQINQFEKILH